jgi:membrane-bound lytic murein transglycosylase F
MLKRITVLQYILLIGLILIGQNSCKNDNTQLEKDYDLPEIQSKGKLIAITDYTSSSYFLYKGTPMGYQYEMLHQLASYLQLELEIVVENDLDKAFKSLQNNECDLLAINLNVTNERHKMVAFTEPIGQTRQVLVQRKPENWQVMASYTIDNLVLRNQLDIGGKTVHVVKNSAYLNRLQNLSNEIGDSITIIEDDVNNVERLISMVSEGEIKYTIADENVAILNQTYYPNIDIKTAISFPQNQAWAVNKNAPLLLDAINNWILDMKDSDLHAVIYNKYYKDTKAKNRSLSPYLSLNGNKISEYDKYIHKYSKQIDWDWRLLASVIYQESRFDSEIKSWAGAMGLMQLMPTTANRFGASEASNPESNIRAGVRFIDWIDDQLVDSIPDSEERIKFVLAAYNVGLGHIQDAQRLAKAHGKNPYVWSGQVDTFLIHKSNPEYYTQDMVKYGFCQGKMACNYVDEVMERYQIYQNFIQ